MYRTINALTLLATLLVTGCSDDFSRPLAPEQGDGTSHPLFGDYPSARFVGRYTGVLPPIPLVEIDYRGCDGLVDVSSGLCIALLVDGNEEMVDTIEPGTLVDFQMQEHGFSPRVDLQHAVIGPVESVDPPAARFSVLGQTVYVTDRTAPFESGVVTVLESLRIGDFVTVSGYFSRDGEVVATLVQRNDSPKPPLLRGVLAVTANRQFRIGEVELDLSRAALEGFPGGAPLKGDTVLVFADQAPQNGILEVSTARYTTTAHYPALEQRITGFVTDVRSNENFDIGGVGVSSTMCAECAALTSLGKTLSVGTLVTAGSTEAQSGIPHLWLSYATSHNTGLVGQIEAIDANAGSLGILGFAVAILPSTVISDETQAWVGSGTFNLSDLAVGDTVSVSGGVLGRTIVADRLGRAEQGVIIRTTKFELTDPAILFLGRNIQTDPSTTVLDCQSSDEICTAADTAWLFARTETPPIMLIIAVDASGTDLRATQIEAFFNR